MRTETNSSARLKRRSLRSKGVKLLPLLCVMLITGCGNDLPPEKPKAPYSLTACATPQIKPQAPVTQDAAAAALIELYSAWEDCFDTTQRLRKLL